MAYGEQTSQIVNETLVNLNNSPLTFDKAFEVTSHPAFWIPMAILMAVPFLIVIIWGALTQVYSKNGKTVMAIQTVNFWIIFLIFFFFIVGAVLFIAVPLWLKLPLFS